ncbi:MAG: sulfite exporter TauE/SafE family protein [Betaproteobacteria bacterium]|nr:sulfite exporter TauE/SafE family protein [Betaproteobacteria bacterium]
MLIAWPAPDAALGAAGAVILLAYTVYGLTGFGSSITAVPLLTQFLPLREVVPMMLLFDLTGGILVGLRNRSQVQWREIGRMAPFMAAGMVLGLSLLLYAPQRVLLLALGGFIFAYALWTLVLRPPVRPLRAAWALPLAFAGGLFTAMFGTGGPVYVIYLARRIEQPQALRATISTLIFGSGLVRLLLFSSAGLYHQPQVLPRALLLFPCMLAGLWLGTHLNRRLPAQRVVQAVWGVLLAAGTSLLLRNL